MVIGKKHIQADFTHVIHEVMKLTYLILHMDYHKYVDIRGQCKHFYSVAQHCLNVYKDLKQLGYDENIQLIGLLHDASEVYISDLPKPFKVEIPEYKIFEERIERELFMKNLDCNFQQMRFIKLLNFLTMKFYITKWKR